MQVTELPVHLFLHLFVGEFTGTVTGDEPGSGILLQRSSSFFDLLQFFRAVDGLFQMKPADCRVRCVLIQLLKAVKNIPHAMMCTAGKQNGESVFGYRKALFMRKQIRNQYIADLFFQTPVGRRGWPAGRDAGKEPEFFVNGHNRICRHEPWIISEFPGQTDIDGSVFMHGVKCAEGMGRNEDACRPVHLKKIRQASSVIVVAV